MEKKVIIVALVALLALGLCAGSVMRYQEKPEMASGGGKVKVVTTLFPLYDMAQNIGADQAEVTQLLPPGVEPHSFEPKPSDIVKINQADIFVYTGSSMEPWVADILKSVTNRHLIVVDASRGTTMIPGVFHDADEPAGSLDPHIWLDFDNAKSMAANIEDAFVRADGAHSAPYQKRAADYQEGLTKLDAEYRAALSNCSSREIIYGGHYAFGYLAQRYGLRYTAAQGISPDAEPTASDLASLVEQIKRDDIRYIFYEELTSPKIAEAISQETGARLLMLNAAHNLAADQFAAGVSFSDILEQDLTNLKIGLNCQ